MKIGFIGSGNMVSAIVKGMTKEGTFFQPQDIYLMSKSGVSAKTLATNCGTSYCESAAEVIENCDVIVFGVKPHVLETLLPQLAPQLLKHQRVVVSLAAGKTLTELSSYFASPIEIIRVMPNINAKVSASTTGICVNDLTTSASKAIVLQMCESFGNVVEVEENQFAIFTALAGSSVAFVYLYMDALARAAVKAGMSKQQALQIVADTVSGSAALVQESEEVPWALIDQVCSPGGTTIEGITTLQERGFEATITKAFDAILAKDQKLGK